MANDIERMQELIGELRELLDDFDFDVHNDEGNRDHRGQAYAVMSDYTEIMKAERTMGFPADHVMRINDTPTRRGDATQHRHVAIEWEGGVLWLDMSDLGDHYCVDVRQFRGEKVAATAVFSIHEGRRVGLAEDEAGGPLPKAHGWPAVFMPILLMDKGDPTTKPEPKW